MRCSRENLMAKKRKFAKWIVLGLVLGVVLLIVSLAHLYINVMPEKQIEREFARIRAQGEAVTLEEAAPAEIPDAENAALIYEQAFSVYYKPGRDEEVKLGQIAGKDLTTWTEEDITAIREYVEKNEDSLHLIFEAASFKKCRFDIDYRDSYAVRLPHLSKMRNCGRLLARDALYKAKEGKINEAVESCRACLRTGKALLDEPFYISQLVRFGTYEIMLLALEKILSENDASPEVLKILLEELDIEESRQGYAKGLQGERCFQIDRFEEVIKDPGSLPQIMHSWTGARSQPPPGRKAYGIILSLGRPLFRRDEIFALSAMQRMIDLAKLPYHQAKADLAKIDQDILNAPFYRIITRFFFPALLSGHRQEARNEARIGLAQLALALKIYKAGKGEYPDALAELVPDILPQLPQDPFTGKDFIYKKEGKGFLIYSLGENTKDEGGKWDEKKRYQHDIPWRCKR